MVRRHFPPAYDQAVTVKSLLTVVADVLGTWASSAMVSASASLVLILAQRGPEI
jgi:hypothetical protein